jgi:hypothetical protein
MTTRTNSTCKLAVNSTSVEAHHFQQGKDVDRLSFDRCRKEVVGRWLDPSVLVDGEMYLSKWRFSDEHEASSALDAFLDVALLIIGSSDTQT